MFLTIRDGAEPVLEPLHLGAGFVPLGAERGKVAAFVAHIPCTLTVCTSATRI